MLLFAQIDHGIVTGILEAVAAPTKLPAGRSFVELESDIALLSTYDEQTKTFTAPEPPPPSKAPATTDEILAEIKKLAPR